ncbi:hypothetical protein [Brevundimonas naejangsanensis]|uniref:hypothetical protein n=1 Tax=Brevundimonas naejangsanensis TaxID=588932 RepID=UPI0013C48500|nr:hypothetical protein [Brevundimonas naejangsanensis]
MEISMCGRTRSAPGGLGIFTEGYEAHSRAPGEAGSHKVRRSGASGPRGRYQKGLTTMSMR